MESNRELLKGIIEQTYSFKPTAVPKTDFNYSHDKIQSQQTTRESCTTWQSLASRYCPDVLKYYPEQKHIK